MVWCFVHYMTPCVVVKCLKRLNMLLIFCYAAHPTSSVQHRHRAVKKKIISLLFRSVETSALWKAVSAWMKPVSQTLRRAALDRPFCNSLGEAEIFCFNPPRSSSWQFFNQSFLPPSPEGGGCTPRHPLQMSLKPNGDRHPYQRPISYT